MRRKILFLIFAVVLLGLLSAARPAAAANCYQAHLTVGYVCDGRYALPTFTTPEELPDSILSRYTYSWIEDHAPLYAQPHDGAAVVGNAGVGFLYSTIQGVATDDAGNRWFRVNGGWTPSGYIHIVEGTVFTGVEVNAQPDRPFGWMMDTWAPRARPGGDAMSEGATLLQRYDFVEIYDAVRAEDGWIWYDIGGGRWVKQNFLSLVDERPRPAEVGPDDFWVDVDLYEQTFAAYEGDRMVFATLVSSGLDRWPTREGLFQVWSRHLSAPMSGGEAGDDFYALTHVPHTMYFDDDISLHGAYWHNLFGHQRSHGCVNMPPRDAEWVYFWSENAPNDLWVWVHSAEPDHVLEKVAANATTNRVVIAVE